MKMDIYFFTIFLTLFLSCCIQGSQHRKRHHHRYHSYSYLRQDQYPYVGANNLKTEWKEDIPSLKQDPDFDNELYQRTTSENGRKTKEDMPRDSLKTDPPTLRYSKESPKRFKLSQQGRPSFGLQGKDPLDHKLAGNSRWTLKFHGMGKEHAKNYTSINITAQVGGNAFLPCKVGHLGDRQISWIRNWKVLASGKTLYAQDQRFTVLHEPGSQDWVLRIKGADLKDVGTYECQVSTGTGVISMFVNLRVVIPEAIIPGHGQFIVEKGSSISLMCVIKNSPSVPKYIFWHHNGELLNFLRDRSEFLITKELRSNETHKKDRNFANEFDEGPIAENDTIISKLIVEQAEEYHSGNYSCSAPNTKPASTVVFITEGDKTAAVQRIDSAAGKLHFQIISVWPILIYLWVMR